MSLRLCPDYRSSTHLLGRDVLAALLERATAYSRAVAFFSSSVFAVAPSAFAAFFRRKGAIRLVASPWFSSGDAKVLAAAVYANRSFCDVGSLDSLPKLLADGKRGCQQALGWLLRTQRLHIRIAHLPQAPETDLYHEKIAVFRDEAHDVVALSGSANESRAAYVCNFERIDVFTTFGNNSDRLRALSIERQFEALWRNETPGVEVLPLHIALRRRLLRVRDQELPDTPSAAYSPRSRLDSLPSYPETLVSPPDIRLRSHQEKAIRAWARAGGRGILEMATGSGKTITALYLAFRLYSQLEGGFVLVIVAPLIHLVDQWREVARRFGLDPLRCAEGASRWLEELTTAIMAVNSGRRPVLSVAVTGASLSGDAFQRAIGNVRKPLLLIGDEVHNYGAPRALSSLPRNAGYRVGLSATPERWFDECRRRSKSAGIWRRRRSPPGEGLRDGSLWIWF